MFYLPSDEYKPSQLCCLHLSILTRWWAPGVAGRVSGLEEDLRTVRQSLAKAETDKRHLHEKLTDLQKVKAAAAAAGGGGENRLQNT